jgi:hypothetical protein
LFLAELATAYGNAIYVREYDGRAHDDELLLLGHYAGAAPRLPARPHGGSSPESASGVDSSTMRLLPGLVAPLLGLLLAACSNLHVSTQHDPDAAQTLGSPHTYAWMSSWKDSPLTAVRQRAIALTPDEHVESLVDGYLQARGLQRVPFSASPDFLVHSTSAFKTDRGVPPSMVPTHPPTEGMGAPAQDNPPPALHVSVDGQLDVLIQEAGTMRPLWIGSAQGKLKADVTYSSYGSVEQRWVEQAVSKMFVNFPADEGP